MTKPSIEKKWLQYYTPEQVAAAQPSRMTMYEYYRKANQPYADKIALTYRDRQIRHAELLEEIPLYARGMVANKAQKGDVISICSNSTPEYIKLFYAANYLGVAVNCADLRMPEDDFIDLLQETESVALFISISAYKKYQARLHDIIDNIILLPDDSEPEKISQVVETTPAETKSFSAFLSECYTIPPVEAVDYEEGLIALIEQTGGSTGKPKSVLLTNENMSVLPDFTLSLIPEANKIAIREKGLSTLTVMPPYTAGGMFAIVVALLNGLTFIMVDDFTPSLYPGYVLKHQPNSLVCGPIIMEQMINSPLMEEADLSFLQGVSVAGDFLTPNMEKRFTDFLRDRGSLASIGVSYGMTETSTNGTTRILPDSASGSVGVPYSTIEFGIFDPESQEEKDYLEEGEICIGGPGLMQGYLNRPEETSQTIRTHEDGRVWLHTGDIGYMNERAEVFIVDRLKNMFKYHGVHIYPTEIDKVLEKHPQVIQAKTIGKNKEGHGDLPYSFVVLKKSADIQAIEPDLLEACREDFPAEAVPQDIIAIDQMPRTRMNKVSIPKLKLALDQHLGVKL